MRRTHLALARPRTGRYTLPTTHVMGLWHFYDRMSSATARLLARTRPHVFARAASVTHSHRTHLRTLTLALWPLRC